MDKELIKYFIDEMKQEQEWHERWKRNHIEMCDYFKYSGKIEEDKAMYEFKYVDATKAYAGRIEMIDLRYKKIDEHENINKDEHKQ